MERGSTTRTATLVQRLTNAPNPRWLVQWDDNGKNDQVDQQAFATVSSEDMESEGSLVDETPLAESTTPSPTLSDASSSAFDNREAIRQAKLSAREERSRRRGRALAPPVKRAKTVKKKADEDCVKIQLLTGTLYLYRGRHRRAEFLRKV